MITLGQLLPSLDPESKIIIINEEGYLVLPLAKEDTVSTKIPRCLEEMDTSYIIPLLDCKVKKITHYTEYLGIVIHI